MAVAHDIDITAFYAQYAPMVLRRCRAILKNEDDALDAMQDVFVSLMRAKSRLHGLYFIFFFSNLELLLTSFVLPATVTFRE